MIHIEDKVCDYQDADGHERGFAGENKPLKKRLYILEYVDKENNEVHLTSKDAWGRIWSEVMPIHTVEPRK